MSNLYFLTGGLDFRALMIYADGAVLINHGVPYTAVLDAYQQAREQHPDFFLGVNFLDLSAYDALIHVPRDAGCLWFDDSRIDESLPDEKAVEYLQLVRRRQEEHKPELLLLPCVAMKGIDPTDDTERVKRLARLAAPYADAVMTSGKQTGAVAPLLKLRAAVEGASPVAVGSCSGSTAFNIWAQKEMGVRVFIVSTSISDQEGRINWPNASCLADQVHK